MQANKNIEHHTSIELNKFKLNKSSLICSDIPTSHSDKKYDPQCNLIHVKNASSPRAP